GNCREHLIRWTYDVNKGDCVKFVYTGCGGNSNNYVTRNNCMTNCHQKREALLRKLSKPP
ncbi:hypothetical protein CAPTEDRAFT_40928, partial [Capitella teleta]